MSDPIVIFSPKINTRLKYTCDVLFKSVLAIDYKLIDDLNSQDKPHINYSDDKLSETLSIKPHALLFEADIKPQNIIVTYKNDIPFFFKTSDTQVIDYDIFASTFYMASRYEEYLPFTPDKHGRFKVESSVAYKAGFLHLPVIHLWAETLKEALNVQFPDIQFPKQTFKQINTIDIDVAYAFKGKPWIRQVGNILKSAVTFNFKELKYRWNYWVNGVDYLDTYDYIIHLAKSSQKPLIFFFEVGKYSKNDRNIPLNNVYKTLIKRLSTVGSIGIHPSYQSNVKTDQLPELIQSLSNVVDQKITKSRQHFLLLTFPETYERLIANGISEDYSMGFSDKIGFRAGLCVPFPFFNLKTNEQRPLTIIPFQVMDGTLKDYMNLSISEAKEETLKLKQQVENIGGTFVSIFHNSSLTDSGEWEGWLEVYEAMIE